MGKQGEVIESNVEQEIWRHRSRPIIPRVVFVSGGMGGIGSAICRRLGQTGHTVIAGCLPGYEKKDEWLAHMKNEGLRVHAADGDVRDFDSCVEMFTEVSSVIGPVDILVNNAGITRDSMFKKMTEKDWIEVINTNLNSVFNVTRSTIPSITWRVTLKTLFRLVLITSIQSFSVIFLNIESRVMPALFTRMSTGPISELTSVNISTHESKSRTSPSAACTRRPSFFM